MKFKLFKKVKKEDSAQEWRQKVNNFLINYFNWLILALMTIILTAGFFFLIVPKYRQITKKIETRGQELEISYQARLHYLTKLNKLQEAYRSIDPKDQTKLEAMIPKTAEIEKLITEVESIAIKNGLILASLSIEPLEKTSLFDKLNAKSTSQILQEPSASLFQEIRLVKIDLNLVGTDYQALKNFLRTLENNLRLIDINQVAYKSTEDKTSLEAYAYYWP